MVDERNNKFVKKLEKILYKAIIKIDFLNLFISISSIISYFYGKEESIIIYFIERLNYIITYIRLFNMFVQLFIEYYIFNIGIKLLDIIVEKIRARNFEVITVIINLLRELNR